MTRNSVLAPTGLIVALAGALALGACGRKGPLEAPPSANAVAAVPPQQQEDPSLGEGDNRNFEQRRSSDTSPAGRPSQKNFILDPLLGEPTPDRQPPRPAPEPRR